MKRKTLSSTVIRAGWIGCNILFDTIPESGKIFYIKDGKEESKNNMYRNEDIVLDSSDFDGNVIIEKEEDNYNTKQQWTYQ